MAVAGDRFGRGSGAGWVGGDFGFGVEADLFEAEEWAGFFFGGDGDGAAGAQFWAAAVVISGRFGFPGLFPR